MSRGKQGGKPPTVVRRGKAGAAAERLRIAEEERQARHKEAQRRHAERERERDEKASRQATAERRDAANEGPGAGVARARAALAEAGRLQERKGVLFLDGRAALLGEVIRAGHEELLRRGKPGVVRGRGLWT